MLPEFPPGPTIRQALSHSTGLQREPPGDIWESLTPPDREQLVGGLEDAERVLRPGVAFHYSNLVFALLGEVVARAGTTYEATLRERILEPVGLTRTALQPDAPVATPYFVHPFDDRVRVEPDLAVTESTSAAGWLWSTVGDLARWGDFLCTGADGVLAKASLDEMARVQTMVDETGWTVGWGLGLELVRRGERILVGHGGAMPGFLAGLFVDRSTRTGAVVLMNTSAGAAPEGLALDLAEAALETLPQPVASWAPGEGAPADVVAAARSLVDGGRGGRAHVALGPTPGRARRWTGRTEPLAARPRRRRPLARGRGQGARRAAADRARRRGRAGAALLRHVSDDEGALDVRRGPLVVRMLAGDPERDRDEQVGGEQDPLRGGVTRRHPRS